MVVRTAAILNAMRPGYSGLRLSADEFCQLPDDGNRYELIDGVVIMSPSPTNSHQHVALEIASQLRNFATANDVGFVLFESDVVLPPQVGDRGIVYRPEMHFILKSRAVGISHRTRIVPDVVLEVVSIDSRGRDENTKFADYERAGVAEYWLVDPLDEKMRFYRLADRAYTEAPAIGDFYESAVVPGFRLDLKAVRAAFQALGQLGDA